ncbi:hypothetical protein XENOCAPTIV_011852, partial [Xenoophorus captivus]
HMDSRQIKTLIQSLVSNQISSVALVAKCAEEVGDMEAADQLTAALCWDDISSTCSTKQRLC